MKLQQTNLKIEKEIVYGNSSIYSCNCFCLLARDIYLEREREILMYDKAILINGGNWDQSPSDTYEIVVEESFSLESFNAEERFQHYQDLMDNIDDEERCDVKMEIAHLLQDL